MLKREDKIIAMSILGVIIFLISILLSHLFVTPCFIVVGLIIGVILALPGVLEAVDKWVEWLYK